MTTTKTTQDWLNRDRRLANSIRSLAESASSTGTLSATTSVVIDGVTYKVTLEDTRGTWSRDRA